MDVLAGDIKIDLPPDEYSDPHVRVVGGVESVRAAGMMVRQELEPQNKVTMKLDVSWTHHSHIIGKGGNTIQPVVKRTGVSIHFPDGNKSSEVRKSNQVSVNSRGEELGGLEEARAAIRNLTPLIFSFSLSASAQFIKHSDPNVLILHVQNTYNVQVELKLTEDPSPLIVGTVRGSEWDVTRVKEATLFILQAYCDTLANQMPVQMSVEISPQHHSFVLGRNNETLRRIMQRTATKITFPDGTDSLVPQLRKSTVTISGAIDNVYLARQNIIGSLPLVLMFEVCGDGPQMEGSEVAQVMQALDVAIIMKARRLNGHQPVIVKGCERNADNIYEAWRLLTLAEKAPPAHIPSTYVIPESASTYGLPREVGVVPWLTGSGGGNSGGSSPIPSPTPTPTPSPQLLWGGLNPSSSSSSSTTSLFPLSSSSSHHHHHHHLSRSQCTNLLLDPAYSSSYYTSGLLRSANLGYNHTNNNNNHLVNNNYHHLDSYSLGKQDNSSLMSSLKLGAIVGSLNDMTLSNGEGTCSSHYPHPISNGSDGSPSLSSPSSPSPHDPPSSPDRILGTHAPPPQYSHQDPVASPAGMNAFSALLQDIDRRAPGCEKKRIELEAQKITSLSDYSSKKVQAARAMKEQVDASPRTPTSSWSGYGFSKSFPAFILRQQKLQVARPIQNTGLEAYEGWPQQEHEEGNSSTTSSADFTPTCQQPLHYSQISQLGSGLGSEEGSLQLSSSRPLVSLSASNFMDCFLSRPHCPSPLASPHPDLTSVLSDLQLEQYIDLFAAQEVDLKVFLNLNDGDLKELGIKMFGHRKRILMAINDMARKPLLSSVTEAKLIGLTSSIPTSISSAESTSSTPTMQETTPSISWD